MVEALQRLLSVAIVKIRNTGKFTADVINKMIDALIGALVSQYSNNAVCNLVA
jgi:hypothetical protein